MVRQRQTRNLHTSGFDASHRPGMTDLRKLQNQRIDRQRRAGRGVDLFTVPSRSARSTFCIFIASTTASVSPDLTSCPSLTAIDTTSPGIGHSSFLPVSAADVTGISRAADASLSVKTLTGTSKP